MASDPKASRRIPVAWSEAVRIQPQRHLEQEVWRELSEDIDPLAVLALLRLTEPDTYEPLGAIDRLDEVEITRGEGAGWVMPAFTLVRCRSAELLAYVWNGTRIAVELRTPVEW